MLPGVARDYLDIPNETECRVAQLNLNYVRYSPANVREITVADGICQANRRGVRVPAVATGSERVLPLFTPPYRAPQWC